MIPAATLAVPMVNAGHRPGHEGQAGLQRAVVPHVLEVQRAEKERRVHPGAEKRAHRARADEAAHPQDAQGHDRVVDSRLEGEEAGHQRDRQRAAAERLSRAPAMTGGLHDRVDPGHQ